MFKPAATAGYKPAPPIRQTNFNLLKKCATNASPPGELAFETLTNCSYYTFFLANRCVRSSREPSSVLIR